jgi:hypothetical protein
VVRRLAVKVVEAADTTRDDCGSPLLDDEIFLSKCRSSAMSCKEEKNAGSYSRCYINN